MPASITKQLALSKLNYKSAQLPGNPQMYALLQSAQNNVQQMNVNSNALQQLSARVTSDASVVNNLLDSIRATFSIPGLSMKTTAS